VRLTLGQRLTLAGLSAVLGAVAIVVVLAIGSQDGREPLPAEIESIYPEPGDITLSQDEIRVDMAFGVVVTLVVDGVEIPASSLRVTEPVGLYVFEPSVDAPIAEWAQGRHTVELRWRPAGGPGLEQTYTWSFETR